ncbi:MAG: LysR substrate-binding domain-containing protein, partial [Burkholderiales bacterium]
MHMTWNQLRIFETVARRLSFTRAAEELHVVQPTVSAQIRLLTDSVGMPLFEQIGKKISLTDAGRELQQTCRELFDSWSRFEMAIADLQGMKRGTLRVSIVSTAKYFVPRMLGPFCKRYPDIDVALEILNRDQVVERLIKNADDLYIMGVPPDGIDVEKHPFLENPLVLIAAHDHPLARARRVGIRQLAQERFVVREQGSGTRLTAEDFFRRHRFRPKLTMQLGNNEAIKWAVAGGLGVAVISQHALMLEPMDDRLARLDVEGFPLEGSWYVVYPAGKKLSVIAKAFFDYLKEEAIVIHNELVSPRIRPALKRRAQPRRCATTTRSQSARYEKA